MRTHSLSSFAESPGAGRDLAQVRQRCPRGRHAVGLLHPNQLDASGNNIPSACPKDSKGWLPIMCTPTTGQNIINAGINYTSFDLAGVKQLVANFGLPAPSAAPGVNRPRAVPAGEE